MPKGRGPQNAQDSQMKPSVVRAKPWADSISCDWVTVNNLTLYDLPRKSKKREKNIA